MPVHVYRVGNFSHTHEREGFRRLADTLRKKITDEEIWVVGNPILPEVIYHYPKHPRTRTFVNVNPDVVIFKKDAVAVIEMKSYPGVIHFPTEKEHLWDVWQYDYDGHLRILNEGKSSPFSQVDTNSKAFIAFFEQYENEFVDNYSKGSLWHKMQKIILFTEENTQFFDTRPEFWRATYLATIENSNPQFDFSTIICDLTMPERDYRNDKRPQISLNKDTIEKLLELLNAERVQEEQPAQPAQQEQSELQTPGYGIVTAVPERMLGFVVTPIGHDRNINVPQNIANQDLPVRLVRYYAHCLEEEANLSLQINLSQTQNYCFLPQMQEPIFHGQGFFEIDGNHLPNNFLQQNVRLLYGFLAQIQPNAQNQSTCEPLFMTDVKLTNTGRITDAGQTYRCEPATTGEVLLNRQALRRFRQFANLNDEEIDRYVAGIQAAQNGLGIIEQILRDLGHQNFDQWFNLAGFRHDPSIRGFFRAALVFLPQSGIYGRTVKELKKIAAEWEKKQANGQPVSDFAWKFLKGLAKEDIHQEWNPALLSIVPSNYEQSRAVGLSLLDANTLQVVSGPPGTGKSQVIQNIFANAYVNEKSILLASKNNKAIDVVIDRLNNKITQLPFAVRSGNIEENGNFAASLQQYQVVRPTQDELRDMTLVKLKLSKLNEELLHINIKYLKYRSTLRRIVEIDKEIEELRSTHPGLFSLTNWYVEQSDDWGAEQWRRHYSEFIKHRQLSNSLAQRFQTHCKGVSWLDKLSKKIFLEKLSQQYSADLQSSLSQGLLAVISSPGTIPASDTILPVLERLLALNKEMVENETFLQSVSETTLLEDWENKESSKIEDSQTILKTEWRKRNSLNVGALPKTSTLNVLQANIPQIPQFHNALQGFSCWATTSLSLAGNVPFESNLFDIVVIDEASQSDIASAIPILYRAKKAVIIGDEMQLRPVITLDRTFDQEIAEAYGLDQSNYATYGYSCNSLLDLAYDRFTRAQGVRLLLKNHYRSHPNIIGFSNRYFYDNLLRPMIQNNQNPGVSWHDVQGQAESRWINNDEVNKVAELVRELFNRGFTHQDIGIVTPFRMQAETIRGRLQNDGLFENNGLRLLVDTAHGFQGDERKVMIFSLCIAPGMPNATIRWVHDPSTYSKNLLNVALTRAQEELHIVGNRTLCQETGGLLGQLVKYVETI